MKRIIILAFKENMKKLLLIVIFCMSSIMMNAQYVDLGLPSHVLWKTINEQNKYNYADATNTFVFSLPTISLIIELNENCKKLFSENGVTLIGPNGNSIFLPYDDYMILPEIEKSTIIPVTLELDKELESNPSLFMHLMYHIFGPFEKTFAVRLVCFPLNDFLFNKNCTKMQKQYFDYLDYLKNQNK